MKILRCRPSTKEPAKENGVLERVRVGMRKDTKVATVARGGTHGRRAVSREEAKGRRKVAREKPEQVARVAKQATFQRGVEKVGTTICTPLVEMTVVTLKMQLTMRMICKLGVCKKKAKMNGGKR